MAKPNIAIKDIELALKFRRAMKNFDASKKINEEDITLILEAIRLTPTSYGFEPFNVIVAQDADFRKKLEKAAGVNAAKFTASHLLIFTAKTGEELTRKDGHIDHMLRDVAQMNAIVRTGYKTFWKKWAKTDFKIFGDNEKLHQWAARQAYIALGFAMMTAAERGIDSCAMEGFSIDKLAEILEELKLIDREKDLPVVMLALGYGNKEPHSQTRRDINEIIKYC
jgi:hypothetical protein